MYFKSRADAGRQLAKKLEEYTGQQLAVVALTEGGLIVGAQIAMHLHANLMLMLADNIYLPGEPDAVAAVTSVGTFSYNNMLTTGQIEDITSEFHGYIDQQKFDKQSRLNTLMGREGEIHKEYLRHRVVILVSDGFPNGVSIGIAADFFKTVAIKKLVIVSPLASVEAVDRMHLAGDALCCLSVVDNYIETNHYYEDNNIPPVEDLFKVIDNIALTWQPED